MVDTKLQHDRRYSSGSTRPITPDIAKENRVEIPDLVLEAFNTLILRDLQGRFARVKQDDVVTFLAEKGMTTDMIHRNRWFDIEAAYRSAGWEVVYDRPGYSENRSATFTFVVPKK